MSPTSQESGEAPGVRRIDERKPKVCQVVTVDLEVRRKETNGVTPKESGRCRGQSRSDLMRRSHSQVCSRHHDAHAWTNSNPWSPRYEPSRILMGTSRCLIKRPSMKGIWMSPRTGRHIGPVDSVSGTRHSTELSPRRCTDCETAPAYSSGKYEAFWGLAVSS